LRCAERGIAGATPNETVSAIEVNSTPKRPDEGQPATRPSAVSRDREHDAERGPVGASERLHDREEPEEEVRVVMMCGSR
jgi:hypothetical protein